MEGDPLGKIISIVITAIVGLVMVIGAFLPIASSEIEWAGGTHDDGNGHDVPNIPGLDSLTFGSSTVMALLSIVVIMVIIGLVISIAMYLRNDR